MKYWQAELLQIDSSEIETGRKALNCLRTTGLTAGVAAGEDSTTSGMGNIKKLKRNFDFSFK